MKKNIQGYPIIEGIWGYAVKRYDEVWIPVIWGDLSEILKMLYEKWHLKKMIFSSVLNPAEFKKHLHNIKREWNEWFPEAGCYVTCIEIEYDPN